MDKDTKQSQQKTGQTKVRRRFEGEVVNKNENKTAHVLVITAKMHKKYHKQYISSKKYAIHDEKNETKVGDRVIFQECRPLSKTKRWRLLEVVKKS
ncbi:MAG: 30S ribosomal protein S17 [Patescibacteria group bacterium]